MGRSESFAGPCTKRFVEITDNTGERTGTGLQSQLFLEVQNDFGGLDVYSDDIVIAEPSVNMRLWIDDAWKRVGPFPPPVVNKVRAFNALQGTTIISLAQQA